MKATNFAPFLMKIPAHMPHTLPNVNSYRFRADDGGGGRSELFGTGGGVATAGDGCCEVGSKGTSTRTLDSRARHFHTVTIDTVRTICVQTDSSPSQSEVEKEI